MNVEPGLVPGASPEQNLARLGLSLPQRPPQPIGNFANTLRTGSFIYISGQGPVLANGQLLTGKVGHDVDTSEAYDHAKIVGLNILAAIRAQVDDLSCVRRVIKLLGMVNAVSTFTEHPQVINGCSDLLCAVLGDAGRHTRSAIGVGSLPNNITVEVEAVVEIYQD